jgi:uncharacterized protein with HEPN domain
MIESCQKILKYTDGLTFDQFAQNDLVFDAVMRNFTILGEAAKNITDDLKSKYPQIPWSDIAGLRDILVHAYHRILFQVVWDNIQNDIPTLLENLKNLVRSEGWEEYFKEIL